MSVTSGPGPGPGGGPPWHPYQPPTTSSTSLTSGTPPWDGAGLSSGTTTMRSFAQIIEQEQTSRNILEINIYKIKNNPANPPRNFTFDDLGELIFDTLKINPEDCLSFDYSTGRYNTRHIKFKPSVDITPYITNPSSPIIFKEHEVKVRQQKNNITKVQFRNVPLNVPNEEILNLCFSYGTVQDNGVHVERMNNSKNKGMFGSTRYVEMFLNKGAAFENFYWLEGPLPGDAGRRITVLHDGQPSQCSHCLRRCGQGCPAQGNEKVCEELKTPRAKMSAYIQSLRIRVGYVSLKVKYYEQQAKNFPSLTGKSQVSSGYSNIEEGDIPEDYDEVLPSNPIEEKDKKISELEKILAEQSLGISDTTQLKENLTKAKAELNVAKKNTTVLNKKINFAKRVTGEQLLMAINDPNFLSENPHLVSVYSTTLNEDDFEVDETDDKVKPVRAEFLKTVEDKINHSDTEQIERLKCLKNQVLEKVKIFKKSHERSLSVSSVNSAGSGKRKQEKAGKTPPRSVRAKSGSQIPMKS